jgi:poly(3-hydroxybutyrate) depolymerase
MKTRVLCLVLVAGIGGFVAAGCQVQDTSDSTCAGFLGCTARPQTALGVKGDTGAAGTGAATTGTAGTTGAAGAGSASNINAVVPGMGCGKPLPEGQAPATVGTPRGYFHWTVQGTGKTLEADQPAKVGPRTFWVRVPPDYDNMKPYRLIFVGQGCGSFNNANNDTLQLYKESVGGDEQAIYVALDIPTDNANMNCYDNRDGPASQEWEAFELFMNVIDANYCIDTNRIYATGYSTGGWLGNMWGCYFAGDGMHPASAPNTPRKFAPKYHVRAQATVTGGEPANNPPCNGPVAAIYIHDAGDNGNPISGSILGLMRVGMMNGCDTKYDKVEAQEPWVVGNPVIDDVCKKFKCANKDYPVVFCTTNGLGHADQHERAIPAFKAFFDLLAPKP